MDSMTKHFPRRILHNGTAMILSCTGVCPHTRQYGCTILSPVLPSRTHIGKNEPSPPSDAGPLSNRAAQPDLFDQIPVAITLVMDAALRIATASHPRLVLVVYLGHLGNPQILVMSLSPLAECTQGLRMNM